MFQRKKYAVVLAAVIAAGSLLAGCGGQGQTADTENRTATQQQTDTESQEASEGKQVADASDMVTPEDVVDPDMVPITADQMVDGTYEVTVDSSSSMFAIASCSLTVADGQMTAVMTMGGSGYLYIYMGTGEEAVRADESAYIPFVENEEGAHTYTVPVEALDKGIACAAFSKRKEMWYDRTLVFRADSLPASAFKEGVLSTGDQLELADGEYTVNVTLEGGSGKSYVESPAVLTVKDGVPYATIVWSSGNYDYMLVDGEKYVNENPDGNSTFTIPVLGFNYNMPVVGDTTAMSTPHEIDYTLYFELVE